MRTLLLSDLHLGSAARTDLLSRAHVRARLVEAVSGADRVVLLGDVLELRHGPARDALAVALPFFADLGRVAARAHRDRKSTRLNSSHVSISYAVFCLKKKTTKDLVERYGRERVFGTPLSEDAMAGAAVGMALAGLRPIHVHIRMDFVMLAMNQLVNIAAKTHYMFGGQESCPLVVRSIIGKSWGQGAQHYQGLY